MWGVGRLADRVEGRLRRQGWNFWAHGWHRSPTRALRGDGAVGRWSVARRPKDQRIDELAAAFALELDEGKRRRCSISSEAPVRRCGCDESRKLRDIQAATVKLKNFVPYRIRACGDLAQA